MESNGVWSFRSRPSADRIDDVFEDKSRSAGKPSRQSGRACLVKKGIGKKSYAQKPTKKPQSDSVKVTMSSM
jgi:hypothetical protein